MNSASGVPQIWRILVKWSLSGKGQSTKDKGHLHQMKVTLYAVTFWKHIQSDPGNRTCPVSSSAMTHPTDQMSAAFETRKRESINFTPTLVLGLTFLAIVHPVKHDFWCSPVACHDVACHSVSCLSAQSKV